MLRMTGGGNHNGLRPVGVTATHNAVVQERLDARYVADGSADGSPWSIQTSNGEDWQILARQNLHGNTTAVPIGEWTVFLPQPYSVRNQLALPPDGQSIVVLNQPAGEDPPGEYELLHFGPDGQRRATWRFTYDPQPLPASVVDSVMKAKAIGFHGWLPEGRADRVAEEYVIMPRTFPPVKSMLVARDGDIWLRQGGVERATASWLVIDPHGQYRAVVRAPPEVDLKYVDGDTAWGIVHDDLDVPYVVRMRLRK